ncbi:aminotransferase class I/II-fold pyridoxal phosphate-dependent enzyme [Fulvivirga lutimaris]|uniref:aminotransferase class I/II-fold pyridoxal phosphate-dependent enzyme n=1 Tax=Fulvivirga lutimaris TaxID=1819566 RepID=UPI0012BBFF27|nr:pyridoxal phosphate-dependent aminotransferase family protein [Fulvivirga lutimaris]MTI39286.1 pyridoxal phosphate-dependent aminotransferase family protein [Fulvivirga lutimaris]
MTLPKRHLDQLKRRKENNSLRSLKLVDSLIDFSSNDYLGLARNAELANEIHLKSNNQRNGSGGSRLLTGNNELFEETEKFLSKQFRAESTLLFNSGYDANLAVLSSIPQRGDIILYDELSHASIKDGIRLGLASKTSFKHNDLIDLEKKLSKDQTGDKYIVIESIYSMDGDEANLNELVKLSLKYNAYLIVDEAHAAGLYGKNGGGLSELYGLQNDIFCRIYTFGKAPGVHGAAVAGTVELIKYLINFARPFIYTTALPAHSCLSIQTTMRYIADNNRIQNAVFENVNHYLRKFQKKLKGQFSRTISNHPIQTIITPGNDYARSLSEHLLAKGFDVRPILAPTVKEGEERLRICLHSYNSTDEISSLVDTLATY